MSRTKSPQAHGLLAMSISGDAWRAGEIARELTPPRPSLVARDRLRAGALRRPTRLADSPSRRTPRRLRRLSGVRILATGDTRTRPVVLSQSIF